MDFLQHITIGMWVMFGLGIVSILLFSWMTENTDEGLGRYFIFTAKNAAFHLIASLMVFFTLEEISEVVIENWIPALGGSGTYHFLMSGLTGLFGSRAVAWIIVKSKKIFSRNS